MGLMAGDRGRGGGARRAHAAAGRARDRRAAASTRCACASPPRPAPRAATKEGLWAKWANGIAQHPLLAGLAALAILIPLMIPLLSLKLGQQDTAALSTSTTARRAYDLLTENFGAGRQRAADRRGVAGLAGHERRTTRACRPCRRTSPPPPGSRRSRRPRSTSRRPPPTSTRSPRPGRRRKPPKNWSNGCARARSPAPSKGTDMQADVGGSTAGYVDLASRISEKLPLQILVVIALSFVLLILAFRTRRDPRAGGGDEPALDRRLLRRAHRDLPVRLAQRPDRPQRAGADRLLRAAVHVRRPVRAVDGLRGVPRQPDRGARARRRGQPRPRSSPGWSRARA